MNAIISLCHFCELHGPKVLFCTQPFHPEEKAVGAGDSEAEGTDGSLPSRRHVASSAEPITPQTPTHNSLPNYKNDLCEGCTSVHLGFVSHDEEAAVSYMSSQRPQHRDVFAMVRQACIRSLSCEVCPGREGPIFFGDEQQALSNVALRKPAFQTDTWEPYDASRAVDGNTNGIMYHGSCMHTKGIENGDYWEVDLEDVYKIGHVIVYNRLDCCGHFTRNVSVFVGFSRDDYVLYSYLEGELGSKHTFQMDSHTYGRWVRITRYIVARIDALFLCEVEVFAERLTNVNNVRFELLPNKIGVATVLSVVSNSSAIICATLCRSSINCAGFNFDTSTLDCATLATAKTSSDYMQGPIKFYRKG